MVERMRCARILGPLYAAANRVPEADIDRLKCFRFHPKFNTALQQMKSELSKYNAAA